MSKSEEVSENEPPFGADYAKTGRSHCKQCQKAIPEGQLRLSVRTPSRRHPGMQDNWLHEPCFWKRARKAKLSEATIRGFESLKWEDQELIRIKIGPAKKVAEKKPTPKAHIPTIDTAKSSRAHCFKCERKFENGAPKIHLKGSNFHPECIKEMGVITVGAEQIEGFDDLDSSQQKAVKKLFGHSNKRKAESSDAGKITSKKAKKISDVSSDEDKAALKKQTELFTEIKEEINSKLEREDIDEILEANNHYRRREDGPAGTIEQLADFIIFGVPPKCPKCKRGQLFYDFSEHDYKCDGGDKKGCSYSDPNPSRKALKVPKDLKSKDFLKGRKLPLLKERAYPPGAQIHVNALSDNPIDKLKRQRQNSEE
uniref:Uncharacterized protein n=1 Tax=Panagrolaimus sp. PS1159 TaxID=55785 RepID=A0AC35FKQ5_9BILA